MSGFNGGDGGDGGDGGGGGGGDDGDGGDGGDDGDGGDGGVVVVVVMVDGCGGGGGAAVGHGTHVIQSKPFNEVGGGWIALSTHLRGNSGHMVQMSSNQNIQWGHVETLICVVHIQ